MDNKGAIVPAAQVPEETSRTFEQVSISKEDGLICNGRNQTDGECDNYYIGKNELHCILRFMDMNFRTPIFRIYKVLR